MKPAIPLLVLALGLASCATHPVTDVDPIVAPATSGPTGGSASHDPAGAADGPSRIDPRRGGLEVGLGEWALTLEAGAIRPGEVTFVVVNRGTVAHGFEIAAEGDSSGHGSGDGLKAETRLLQPGERTRLTLNLGAGLYKVECLVDGHDDLGMEGLLEVRAGAPLVRVEAEADADAIAISGFAFDPPRLEVLQGTSVTWTNGDPTPHTVTAEDGSFDSGTLEPGDTFTFELGSGAVAYLCQIHPEMRGELVAT